MVLRAYPDALCGRNKWERTPFEGALFVAGENGCPHQTQLLRCIRKRPTYWNQPPIQYPTATDMKPLSVMTMTPLFLLLLIVIIH